MKKKIIISLFIFVFIFIIIWCFNKNSNVDNSFTNNRLNEDMHKNNNNIYNESEKNNTMEDIMSISILIDGKKYIAKIEDNKTAQAFVSSLPQEFNMKELNGNEKYIYMDNSLPTNPSNPKHIEAGDIMLYGEDCLVIFYQSFDTNYSYTRIGHIDNLPNLGSDSVMAKFEKIN